MSHGNLLRVENLSLAYPLPRRQFWRKPQRLQVVHDVSFSLEAGRTLGLVGESGSGKSSIGQAILGNLMPAAGSVQVLGWDVAQFRGRPPFAYRQAVQIVWQNPYASLTPSLPVGTQIVQALSARRMVTPTRARALAQALLRQVGLRPEDAAKRAHQFSGGQRQRIAIARALALEPRLIVLDEPVSALDVITQSQILRLLQRIQQESEVAYVLISHDLGVVRHLADEVVVLRQGGLVERGRADTVCDRPTHDYTRELIAAILEPPFQDNTN